MRWTWSSLPVRHSPPPSSSRLECSLQGAFSCALVAPHPRLVAAFEDQGRRPDDVVGSGPLSALGRLTECHSPTKYCNFVRAHVLGPTGPAQTRAARCLLYPTLRYAMLRGMQERECFTTNSSRLLLSHARQSRVSRLATHARVPCETNGAKLPTNAQLLQALRMGVWAVCRASVQPMLSNGGHMPASSHAATQKIGCRARRWAVVDGDRRRVRQLTQQTSPCVSLRGRTDRRSEKQASWMGGITALRDLLSASRLLLDAVIKPRQAATLLTRRETPETVWPSAID